MHRYLSKTIKYLVLFVAIVVVIRIAYVNLTSKNTETIVNADEVITFNNLEIRLSEVKAARLEDTYRIEFELEIKNNTGETREFAYYQLAAYSDMITNGVIPCNTEEYLGNISQRKSIKPGETFTSRYSTEIYRIAVDEKSWQDIEQKEFKILLLEYANNIGWQVNPEECDAAELGMIGEEETIPDENADLYIRKILSEEEFYRTQFVSVGESVTCLWRTMSNVQYRFIDITVEDVTISKELTENCQYILDDIEKSSMWYSPYIAEMVVKNHIITNEYSAVKAKIRVNAQEEAAFMVDDLHLYQLDNEFYPVSETPMVNPFYSAFLASDCDNDFLGYQIQGGYYISDQCEGNILLKKGVNEFTMVYIVPDVVLEASDVLYFSEGFIGYGGEKFKHSYSNTGLLIKWPLREE